MQKTSGNSLWEQYLEKHHYSSLDNNIDTDVLIIGGGVTGALTGYLFNEQGINCTVIEQDHIGHASTKATTAILQYEIDSDLVKLQSYIGEEDAANVFKLTLNSLYKLDDIIKNLDDDCDYVRRPCFYYTTKEEEKDYMYKEYQLRSNNQFEVEYVDEKNNKERFSFPYCSGILSYNSGAEVNPIKLTNEIYRNIHKKGVPIYENTKAVEFNILDNQVEVTCDNGHTITCKKVVIACGYDGLQYFEDLDYTITRTFSLATKPIEQFTGWFGRSIIRNNEDPYLYLRTTKDNRIIIGGEDITISKNDNQMLNIDEDSDMANYKYQLLEKKLNEMFPNIEGKQIEFKFNGIFIDTKDGMPYVGETEEYPNFYFNIGIGSNGILYGLLGATALVDSYLGKDNNEVLKLFKFKR